MFTGIVETVGRIVRIEKDIDNLILHIESPIAHELKIDQSVAHNGICLTVTAINDSTHTVCAVPETIQKTSIATWQVEGKINLERCMHLNDRMDGHIVQGHVDTTALCTQRIDGINNWQFTFSIDSSFAPLIIEKGSVTVNGTSLTCFNVSPNSFDVAIIPYTFEHTNFPSIQVNSSVNIEFDIVGKYITRMLTLQTIKK